MPEQNIDILYKENGEMHRYLIEWRHKLMVRFFIAIAALLTISQWLIQSNKTISDNLIALPLMVASLISIGFYFMDKRNYALMTLCVRVGAELEQKVSADALGIYASLASMPRPRANYSTVLAFIYLGSGVLFLLLGALVIVT